MTEHELLVIGGGIAGTMAVLAAAAQGVDVVWVADEVRAADQSAHWHGHLHRGRLYDPVRERELIAELSQNVPFWWSRAARPFHTDLETMAIGPDAEWARAFSERMGVGDPRPVHPAFLRPDVTAVATDEAILDGPRFLAVATEAAAARSRRIDGRCHELRRTDAGAWQALVETQDPGGHQVTARAVILATGTAVTELLPSRVRLDHGLGTRMSRMLALRGALPPAAAIMPSRAAGGLFFASREIPAAAAPSGPTGSAAAAERIWLLSDGFSSPGETSPGALTDGWWTCSVLERIGEFVREDVLAETSVAAYHAPKSRLASSATQVPARGYSADAGLSFAALTPSKWSSSPTAAAEAVAALLGAEPVPVESMSALLDGVSVPETTPILRETWQSLVDWTPYAPLRVPGLDALRQASALYERGLPEEAAARSVA